MRQSWTDERLDDLNAKVDRIDGKVDRVDAKVDRVAEDLRALGNETKTEFAAARSEMHKEFTAVRSEMKAGFDGLYRLIIGVGGSGVIALVLSRI